MNTVCFIGHRKIEATQKLSDRLSSIIEDYILAKNSATFLFGSRSEFDELSLRIVTKLKDKYPLIQRIYQRAEYPYINQEYLEYLLTFYDDTIFHDCLFNVGKSIYVKRNKIMIDSSNLIIFYCNLELKYNSGTVAAYKYALAKKKNLINLYEN